MPPRAGMPEWPFSADSYTLLRPSFTRLIHAARSPIFGAPPTPWMWHLPHVASTTCWPVRSGRGRHRGCGRGGGRGHRRRRPVGAALVRHEDDGALHFVVGQFAVAALRGHRADAADRVLEGELVALRDDLGPRGLVAELRRSREAGLVARLAHLPVDLLAREHALGTGRLGQHDRADGLDPLQHEIVVLRIALLAARDELRNHDRERDRNGEREQHDDDELLRGLDRGGMLFGHGGKGGWRGGVRGPGGAEPAHKGPLAGLTRNYTAPAPGADPALDAGRP